MAIGIVDSATLKTWREQNQAVLVDVREQEEWNAGHIEGATLIPLATVPYTPMPDAAGRKLVIYCRSGRRSMTACELLSQLHPGLEVYNLEGGILAWDAAAK